MATSTASAGAKSEFLGLRTTIYTVPDIAKAKAWYAKVFNTQPYFDEPFYVGFNIGGFELGLTPQEGNVSNGEGVKTYWGVDNVQKVYRHLLENGATKHEEPADVGGDIVVATVKDPWGNIVGIIYNPHFKIV
jgi:predicted enzyme related to lactoylglutathione lyase